ncbi:MAG: hypothetical protein J1E95_03895 [Muribaculaceae bacterium]|nr:hypothetical protein [Muribaculaceae bacterium]
MDNKKLIEKITDTVKEYILDEENYSDDVQLEINTRDWSMDIADPENDLPECDYYPIMDLVKMSVKEPGKWEPDMEAIESIAAEYVFTSD